MNPLALVLPGRQNIIFNEPSAAVLNIQKELLADPGESARMAGQIALTTTLGAMIYNGVMNGTVIGGGPGRFRRGGKASVEQRAWEQSLNAQGRQKYSVMTPFGSLPWDRIGEPMTIVLKMYADIAQVSGFVTEEEKDEMLRTPAASWSPVFIKGRSCRASTT